MFNGIYAGKKVLVTGHTGFKGSYLCCWLETLGAEICGVALPPEKMPSHFTLLNSRYRSELFDIRQIDRLTGVFQDFQPDMVFHLAAQPLVRRSYSSPRETFEVNVMGTVNVLEAARRTASVRGIVVVTSDKCYDNRETGHPYQEDDPMGGTDPYSASKGCAELIVASFRQSFFAQKGPLTATARAGNVIGGGDWAEDRLVPDLMRGAAASETTNIRNPDSVRPWQHVFEPLSGYLQLGQKLLEGDSAFAVAWNFGPDAHDTLTVRELTALFHTVWPKVMAVGNSDAENKLHEAVLLHLDCAKARKLLHWRPVWGVEEAVRRTVRHYRDYYEDGQLSTLRDLHDYCAAARLVGLEWAK